MRKNDLPGKPGNKGSGGKPSARSDSLKPLNDLLSTVDRSKVPKLSPETAKQMIEDVWSPFVKDMMAIDAQLAMEMSKEGMEARRYIYDHVLGKPTNAAQQASSPSIQIALIEVTDRKQLPQIKQQILDGEYTIIDSPKALSSGEQDDQERETALQPETAEQDEAAATSVESVTLDA